MTKKGGAGERERQGRVAANQEGCRRQTIIQRCHVCLTQKDPEPLLVPEHAEFFSYPNVCLSDSLCLEGFPCRMQRGSASLFVQVSAHISSCQNFSDHHT